MSLDIQYGGHWKVPGTDEVFDGTLHYSEENRVILLELTKPFDIESFGGHILGSTRVSVVCGVLFSGSHVALLNCLRTNTQTEVPSHMTELVYADYALWGFTEEDCKAPAFNGAVIDYGNIGEWAGLSWYYLDTNKGELGDTIKWSHEKRLSLTWPKGCICNSPLGKDRSVWSTMTTMSQSISTWARVSSTMRPDGGMTSWRTRTGSGG